MQLIETVYDVERGLRALQCTDPRLVQVVALARPVPLRRRSPNFESLARIVLGQQLSTASANAIWARMAARFAPLTPDRILACASEDLRALGLSTGKVRTLTAVAQALADGLHLESLANTPTEEARAILTAIHGIGPWTADVFLLFSLGHPDIFPNGDLALQRAVQDALDLPKKPTHGELATISAVWSPWRGVAARLFWAFYGARRRGAGVSV